MPTVTATTTPTPTISLVELFDLEPLPDLIWTDERRVVAIINDAASISWSPITNEFTSTNCNGPPGYTSVVKLLKAAAPDFAIIDITPSVDEVHGLCKNISDALVWAPSGEELVFVGGTESNYLAYGSLWIMNNQGQNARLINPGETNIIWLPRPIGWFRNHELFYTSYSGGGNVYGHTINRVVPN
jgi:hypothetical protein